MLDHKDKDWAVRRITARQLASLGPLSHGDLWTVSRPPDGERVSGFELYLGIFDKELLSRVVRDTLKHRPSEIESHDDFERGDYEGLTCFAKLKLNAHAELQIEHVSVSTAPWAIGRLQQVGFSGLDFDLFQSSVKSLKHDLAELQTKRLKRQTQTHETDEGASATLPLVRTDIEHLLQLFYSWASFKPDESDFPLAVIRALTMPDSKEKAWSANGSAEREPLRREEQVPSSLDDEDTDEEGDDDGIDILNSFFAKDIQRVLKSLSANAHCYPLLHYLTPIPVEERISLYTEDGRKHISAKTWPAYLPSGRWLSQPDHAMSLMQQLAINEAIGSLKHRGIFSVNGPPGTGKTTLLRDIIAEVVTQRARVLAALPCSRDAFVSDGSLPVYFEDDGKPKHISILCKDLIGFEMVVASTNNAAVENISGDLPKASSLGNQKEANRQELAWRRRDGAPKWTYLQPVARQYAARNRKGQFDQLSIDDNPWALISCALGNIPNRKRFRSGLFCKASRGKEPPPEGFDPQLHKTIWEWRNSYSGPTFSEAAALFRAADLKVEERRTQLVRYAEAAVDVSGRSLEDYVLEERQALDMASAAWESAHAEADSITAELASVKSRLANIEVLKSLNREPSVSIFKRLVSCQERRAYRSAIAAYEENKRNYESLQREAVLRRLELWPKEQPARIVAAAARSTFETAKSRMQRREKRWNRHQATLRNLAPEFPEAEDQRSKGGIEATDVQKKGLWPDSELNRRRSELFAAALTMHEAWLAEVSRKDAGFGGNLSAISRLFEGGRLQNPEHALQIWRSLFMVVPVVSTTFASVGNQFRDLGPDSLGWLFIDEAGQAVPQAAVGALWRCKRAVVVGDPLQIEPVFTVPTKLIEELERSSDVTGEKVAPHNYSVQNLADEANALGAIVISRQEQSGTKWVGSPLRVHRRCSDPMFELANRIAYDGKMIFGSASRLPPNDSLDLGNTAWVDISGVAENKQVVQAQIDLAVEGLITLSRSIRGLPPVYVISPFRRIATALRARLSDVGCWNGIPGKRGKPLTKSEVRDWCKSHLGTVHTFQGKQQSIVWMVLGCDSKTMGAVNWAAKKPNILNVALTRAEHRFFMIGEAELWQAQENFRELAFIQRISGMGFLSRMAVAQIPAEKKMALHDEV